MYENEILRDQFTTFGVNFNPNVVLTLTTHKSWNAAKMNKLVSQFFGRLDRKLLGNAWLEMPTKERIDGIAFVEKPNVKVHAHCCVRLNVNRWYETLRASIHIWKQLCPSGAVHFEPISYPRPAVDYCLKETERDDYKFEDQIILLGVFHPQP
ncbi:MAG: hypothetical protein ABJM29_10555 [Rhizobiaceae bacterium]